MTTRTHREDGGFSLVATMLALSLLALFGMIAASIAVNERRTTFNELVHNNSLMAADSGTEAATAWLLTLDRSPKDLGGGDYVVRAENDGDFVNDSGQSFEFTVQHMETPRIRVGGGSAPVPDTASVDIRITSTRSMPTVRPVSRDADRSVSSRTVSSGAVTRRTS